MTGRPEGYRDDASEILRRASAALGGCTVSVWEVTPDTHLAHQASMPVGGPLEAARELESALMSWGVPVRAGSKWVTARAAAGTPWVIAPVRYRPPAPPPEGRERRSKERLTLELAGLALGLADRRDRPSASASLQELAGLPAMIAHEAGNPLTAARAGLQLAIETLRDTPGALPAASREEVLAELQQVLEDIDRAVSFLRAVQDRARGAFTRTERFDVVKVMQSCLTLEKRLLLNRKIALSFETSVESAYLTGDPNSLFELAVNLIRNAADSYEGRPGPVKVRLAREEERLLLRVTDSGGGISAEHLPLIFEPGFTTKEFGTGSGMGLALVRSVAQEVFAGTVHVDSIPGAGTTFIVSLPIPPQRISGGGASG